MTTNPQPTPEYARPQPAAEKPGLDAVMDYVGNDPPKLAGILALASLPPGESVTKQGFVGLMNDVQGPKPGWDFTNNPTMAFAYAKGPYQRAGIVELGSKIGASGSPAEAVRLNEQGYDGGVTVAGALLLLAMRAPKGISLQTAMGASHQQRAATGKEPTRLAMYRELLRRNDSAASVSELGRAADVSRSTATVTVRDLTDAGIVRADTRHKPVERTFTFNEPPETLRTYLSRMSPEIGTVVTSALNAYENGVTHMTGEQILDMAHQANPSLSMTHTWQTFLRWMRENDRAASFIAEQTPAGDKRLRTRVALVPRWETWLQELLHVRRMLREDSLHANQFREAAQARAHRFLEHPRTLAIILSKARQDRQRPKKAPHGNWLEHIADYVPPEGISTADLHAVITGVFGKTVAYAKFRKRLNEAKTLDITEQFGGGRGGGAIGYVSLSEATVFTDDWRKDATCLNDKAPTDRFYPEGSGPAKAAQAAKAKQICRGCPVRLACLRTALDSGEEWGVWGGVWLENAERELPEAERKWALNSVIIATPNG